MTTYYVDRGLLSASDSNVGTTPSAPFLTIARANNVVSSGDKVIVRKGTYPESTTLKTDNVTWQAEDGVVIDLAGLGNGFTLPGLNNVTIEGFKIQGSTAGYGISVQGGGGQTVRYNEITGCVSGGIRMQPQSPQLFTPTDGGAGGTLTAGSKSYAVTAIISGQETLPSFTLSITITANHTVVLSWSKIPAATSFIIYGRGPGGLTKLATVANSFGAGFPTWTDDGSLSPDGVTNLPVVSGVLMGASTVLGNEIYSNNSHGLYLFGANAVAVLGNDCHHNRLHGIALLNASNDNRVAFNRSYRNGDGVSRVANGIQCDSFGTGTPGAQRNLIELNACFRNDDSGISIYNASDDSIVRRNLCYANGDHGIDVSSASRAHVVGNTAVGNVTAGINVEGPSADARVYNNLAVDNGINSPRTSGNYRCDNAAAPTARFDYNASWLTTPAASQPVVAGLANAEVVWGTTLYGSLAAFRAAQPTQMAHGVAGDPKFASVEASDFHTLVGSVARGAGASGAPDHQPRDFDGTLSGSAPDCGAYQSI